MHEIFELPAAVISMRGEKHREQMDQQFSMQRGCNTWPRQRRRHFGWKCEAGSFDRTRIHFRTVRHWRSIIYGNDILAFTPNIVWGLRDNDFADPSIFINDHHYHYDRNWTDLSNENTPLLTHSRTGKILIASGCIARYVRVWQYHSRNILGKAVRRSFLGNAKCMHVSA